MLGAELVVKGLAGLLKSFQFVLVYEEQNKMATGKQ
jgi:hypothetical protein